MKKIFYVALMAMMVMMTACQQSKEDYIKEFKSFVHEVSEECADYTDAQWENAAKEFEALVKQAEKYEDLTTEETLELAKENNCICEINTRGIYKGRYNDYYPSKEIIKIMNEKNIPAVVSTDAHHPDDLDKFEGIYEYLKQINYKNILYLDSDGIWKDYSI